MAAAQIINSLSSEALLWLKNSSNFMFLSVMFIFLSSWYCWILAIKSKIKSFPLPPGPRGLPLIGNFLSLQPEIHTYFTSLSQKYGPIFSIKLGTKLCVVVNSPKSASEVLKDQDVIFANRDPPAVTSVLFEAKDIVWSPYGPEWRMLRKVCVKEMLNSYNLDNAYYLRRREIRKTVAHLYNQAGSQVEVRRLFFEAVFNVIISMLWGSGTKSTPKGTVIQDIVAEMTYLEGALNISDYFPLLASLDLQGRVKQMRRVVAKFDKMYDEMINNKEKMEGDGKDLLQVLLDLKEEKAVEITMIHIKSLLTDMIVGGTETTSITIEFAMSEMMKKPQVMTKAQEELDRVVGKNNIVEEAHIHKLSYLNAVIKESLRLHPVLPNLVPHSPSKTCTIGGYTIPKGTCVFINVYAIHRDPTIWKDPEDFNPERFLTGEFDFSGRDFRYLPFGSGRRICPGISLAERMLVFSLASFLHSFDWKLPNGERLDISDKFGIVLKKKSPLIAIPLPRLSDPILYE